MRRIGVVGALLAALVVGTVDPVPATAVHPARGPDEVRLVPAGEGRIIFRGGRYNGQMTILARSSGLGLIERQTIDGYLSGIREVPFSWPDEALQAQAVAARTYLAWTLQRGRSSSGRRYGFDICASTRCQVYRGVGVVEVTDGERWVTALDQTTGEILIFDDAPAQTLYSASFGSESRGVEEIWGGDGLPYLVRVSSPEAGVSPFDEWVLEIPTEVFAQVLRFGGVPVGTAITSVSVDAAPGRVSTMRIESSSGVTTLALTSVRAIFNVHGPVLYPGIFPGDRSDGRRLPQSLPSYSFDAELGERGAIDPIASLDLPPQLPPGELPEIGLVTIVGEGWGHGVGMSQWGAFAMADSGATAEQILAHYYGGLEPRSAGALLRDDVFVGLTWDQSAIEFEVAGRVIFEVDGRPTAVLEEGLWRAEISGGGVVLVPIDHDASILPQGRLLR